MSEKMTGAKMTGGCACGRVRFEAEIDSDEAYLCHCRMCQRASGNVSLAMKNVPQENVRWGHEPDWYRSSPIAQRPYCAACGTSLGFRYDSDTDQMDLTVAVFDDPSRFRPTSHFGAESVHEAWIDTTALPRTRTDEYQKLVDRWEKAGVVPQA
ncbi:MAG: GFA family protein [Sphingomicrobium sp.]